MTRSMICLHGQHATGGPRSTLPLQAPVQTGKGGSDTIPHNFCLIVGRRVVRHDWTKASDTIYEAMTLEVIAVGRPAYSAEFVRAPMIFGTRSRLIS